MTNKRQRTSTTKGLNKSNKLNSKSQAQHRDMELQSETSLGTEQLKEKASRSTETVFSQMLSRSK